MTEFSAGDFKVQVTPNGQNMNINLWQGYHILLLAFDVAVIGAFFYWINKK